MILSGKVGSSISSEIGTMRITQQIDALDIYVKLSKDDAEYDFCLEYYLNGSDEEFYNMVGGLEEGQVVDVEGFLYWYEGANPHITAVTVK